MQVNKKLKWLIVVFLFLVYFSYEFAISKTIYYYKLCSDVTAFDSKKYSIQTIKELTDKEKQMDLFLVGYQQEDSVSKQNQLLIQLNALSHSYGLTIVDLKEPHSVIHEKSTKHDYLFTLQGSYRGCLQLIHTLENKKIFGGLSHINFYSKTNLKSNAKELFVDVILSEY